MEITAEALEHIKTFNRNVDWLKRNKASVGTIEEMPEFIDFKDAMKFVDRSRNWLKSRMIDAEVVENAKQTAQPININWFLVYGTDWIREGRYVLFNTESLIRLKKELVAMGEAYQKSIQN